MSLIAIRTAIKEILAAVPGVENVHDYIPWANMWQNVEAKFKTSDGFIKGWMISLQSVASEAVQYRIKRRALIFAIRGFMGVKDAIQSEHIFNDLIEPIELAFDSNKTLNGTCETIWPVWGPMAGVPGFQTNSIDFRNIAGVECHFADCRLCAVELQS